MGQQHRLAGRVAAAAAAGAAPVKRPHVRSAAGFDLSQDLPDSHGAACQRLNWRGGGTAQARRPNQAPPPAHELRVRKSYARAAVASSNTSSAAQGPGRRPICGPRCQGASGCRRGDLSENAHVLGARGGRANLPCPRWGTHPALPCCFHTGLCWHPARNGFRIVQRRTGGRKAPHHVPAANPAATEAAAALPTARCPALKPLSSVCYISAQPHNRSAPLSIRCPSSMPKRCTGLRQGGDEPAGTGGHKPHRHGSNLHANTADHTAKPQHVWACTPLPPGRALTSQLR